MANRIYIVTQKGAQPARLVRAGNRAQAINFVARDTLSAEVADQDALVEAITMGIKIEDSGSNEETE